MRFQVVRRRSKLLPRVSRLVNATVDAAGLLDLRALRLWPVNGLNVHWNGHGSQVHQDHSSQFHQMPTSKSARPATVSSGSAAAALAAVATPADIAAMAVVTAPMASEASATALSAMYMTAVAALPAYTRPRHVAPVPMRSAAAASYASWSHSTGWRVHMASCAACTLRLPESMSPFISRRGRATWVERRAFCLALGAARARRDATARAGEKQQTMGVNVRLRSLRAYPHTT